jgi:hypothetical protein
MGEIVFLLLICFQGKLNLGAKSLSLPITFMQILHQTCLTSLFSLNTLFAHGNFIA